MRNEFQSEIVDVRKTNDRSDKRIEFVEKKMEASRRST